LGLFFSRPVAVPEKVAIESRLPTTTIELISSEKSGDKDPVETAERPDWVGAEPRRVGDAYQRTIVVGPYTTRLECDTHLPVALEEALAEYVEACLGREAVARVRLPRGELERLLLHQQWEETKEYATVGPMKNLHVLLQFDRKLKGYITQRWKEAIIADRLWITGGTISGVLVLLTGLFVFLKIHSGREQRLREMDS
jgi:hypothetical protein